MTKCVSCEMYEKHRHLAKQTIDQMRPIVEAVKGWAKNHIEDSWWDDYLEGLIKKYVEEHGE